VGTGIRFDVGFLHHYTWKRRPVPAVEAWAIEPIWVQFQALLPPHVDDHPWGCHNPRTPDRDVFDKLVAKIVFGGFYRKHADATCTATTIRGRRDEWITAGLFARLEQIVIEAYDAIVGLDLADITVDGQIRTRATGPSDVRGDGWPLLCGCLQVAARLPQVTHVGHEHVESERAQMPGPCCRIRQPFSYADGAA
jgi:transposase